MIIENWLSFLRRGAFRGLLRSGHARRLGWRGFRGRAANIRHQAKGRATIAGETLETRTMLAATLNPGNLAVVGYNADTNDFVMVALTDVPANSTVFFTDRGWGDGDFHLDVGENALETTSTWVTPASDIPAGTLIRIDRDGPSFLDGASAGTLTGSGTFDTSSGDQVLIYQTDDDNPASAPVFITAFNGNDEAGFGGTDVDGDGWQDTGGDTGNQNSNLPAGLTANLTAYGIAGQIAGGEVDNYVYNGPVTSASPSVWLARIGNAANWISDNGGIGSGGYDFSGAAGSLPAPPSTLAVEAIPETILVTTEIDENDGTLDTGTGAGTSLREAIIAANLSPDANTITFDPSLDGTDIALTLSGSNEDASATGDLDITSEITIIGNGAVNTVIDASGLTNDRVLHVETTGVLTLQSVTLTGGTQSSGIPTPVGTRFETGGGVRVESGGVATIRETTISGNEAINGGGIYSQGDVTVASSTITDNNATALFVQGGGGGGATVQGGTFVVENSTLSGNAGDAGAAITVRSGNLTVTNSTVASNDVSFGSGGSGISGPATLNNTIVADTIGGNDLSGTFTGSHNLIENMGSATGLSNTVTGDPMLGPLQDNGGPTLTHALLAGSPAIDAGSDALAVDGDMNPLTTDQRGAGFPRILGDQVDIGAFESIPETIVVTTATDENDGGLDPTNGTGVSLREAILAANFNPNDANMITFDPSLDGVDIVLTLSGGGDTQGDLDIASEITIVGNGAVNTVIDAGGDGGLGDRVLDVLSGGMLTLEGVTVTGGRVGNVLGGGIRIQAGGTAEISDTAIDDNQSIGGSGGGISNEGVLTLVGSAVTGNQVTSSGGGLAAFGASVTNVVNSTFSGNSASGSSGSFGSGVGHRGGTVTITNSTITENTSSLAPLGSGGVVSSSIGITLNNTIVAGNTANGSPEDLRGSFTGSNNIIGDGDLQGLDSNTNLTGDPMLGALQDNGGPTLTHALLAGSPAIDAGVDALAVDGDMNPLTTDQRGAGRFVGTVDIGAVEAIPETIVVTTATDENDGGLDPTDGTGVSLREAILAANFNPNDANTITFDPSLNGTDIGLAVDGAGEDASARGDLDITSEVTIVGNGPGSTVIDAGGLTSGIGDRVFDVQNGGLLTLEGVTLTGGVTPAPELGGGGGLRIVSGGSARVINSTVRGNNASDGSGVGNLGTLVLENSTIEGNTAIVAGGGLLNQGDATIINSTISGNDADLDAGVGGAIFNLGGGTLTVTNSTISGNTSRPTSSSVINMGAAAVLNNTIVANSIGGDDLEGVFSGSHNLIENIGTATGLSNTVTGDPMLGPLQDNGGPTLTHALLAGSPASDAGSDALAVDGDTNLLTTDQRGAGFDRFVGTVDIGAFERDQADLSVSASDNNDPILTGQSTNYTVVLTNNGPGDVTGVSLVNTIAFPGGQFDVQLTGQSFSGSGSFNAIEIDGNGPNILGISLASGATFTVTLTATPTRGEGTMTLTSTAQGGTPSDNNGSNNSAMETTTVNGASIGDFVWNDLNGDGVQDGGEPGLAGVRVFVDLLANGTFDALEPSDITDSSGAYDITGLAAGTYTVIVDASTVPAGFNATHDFDGVGTPLQSSVTIAAGENFNNADFGFQPNIAPVVDNQSFTVSENTLNTTVVDTVVASDANAGDTLSYAITAGNGTGGGAFAIDNDGIITVADSSQLDFEATPTFTLTVEVTDDGAPTNLSDTATITINLANVSEPLTLSLTNATATTYVPGVPVRLLPDATIGDHDGITLDGAIATVTFEAGRASLDRLFLLDDTDQRLTNGDPLIFDGVNIGTVNVSGLHVRVTFNANATYESVETVFDRVEYVSLSPYTTEERAGVRTLRFRFIDGENTSVAADYTLDVQGANLAPELMLSNTSAIAQLPGPPVRLLPFATVTDPDSPSLDGARAAVRFASAWVELDRVWLLDEAGQRLAAGTDLILGGVTVGQVVQNGLLVEVVFNANATLASIRTVFNQVEYDSYADFATPDNIGMRTLEFLAIDREGTATVKPFTLDVQRVNLAPQFTLDNTQVTADIPGPAVRLLPFATFADPDSVNLNGVEASVLFASPWVQLDRLWLLDESGQRLTDGDDLILEGVLVGSVVESGFGVKVIFNASATSASVRTVFNRVEYGSLSPVATPERLGLRTLQMRVVDAENTATRQYFTVNTQRINTAPELILENTQATASIPGPAVRLLPFVTFADPDSASLDGVRASVRFMAGRASLDRLWLLDENGQRLADGDDLILGGMVVGSVEQSGYGVKVVFNANATQSTMQTVFNRVEYGSLATTSTPERIGVRTLEIRVIDAEGAASRETFTVDVS